MSGIILQMSLQKLGFDKIKENLTKNLRWAIYPSIMKLKKRVEIYASNCILGWTKNTKISRKVWLEKTFQRISKNIQ